MSRVALGGRSCAADDYQTIIKRAPSKASHRVSLAAAQATARDDLRGKVMQRVTVRLYQSKREYESQKAMMCINGGWWTERGNQAQRGYRRQTSERQIYVLK